MAGQSNQITQAIDALVFLFLELAVEQGVEGSAKAHLGVLRKAAKLADRFVEMRNAIYEFGRRLGEKGAEEEFRKKMARLIPAKEHAEAELRSAIAKASKTVDACPNPSPVEEALGKEIWMAVGEAAFRWGSFGIEIEYRPSKYQTGERKW